jgi:glycogen(starch) synthase
MRIAFITWEFPPFIVGGLGTYSDYISRWLAKLGHEIQVFAPRPAGIEGPREEERDGVVVHWVDTLEQTHPLRHIFNDEIGGSGDWVNFFGRIVVFNSAAASRVAAELSSGGVDVYAYNDWLCAPSGIMLSQLRRAPGVYHVHSTEWGRTLGGGSRTITEVEGLGAVYADKVITVSQAMREDLIVHGWQGEKIHVVWNGVDPDVYDPSKVDQESVERIRQRYGIGPDDKMMLFVGRLVVVKGVRELVESLPHILSEFPRTKLVILGKGDMERELQSLVHHLNIARNVVFRTEFVSEQERILHYAAADLCVFPSIYEPFGIVSLEAMSMAKPVVVGARGVVGFREQVIPSGEAQCGIHVDGSNPIDIAWGVKEVLRDPDRAARWGQNGRRRVLSEFTWKRAAERTIEVYSMVAER